MNFKGGQIYPPPDPGRVKEINWLPVKDRFEQNVTTHIFKQQNNLAPKYMDEMFTSADQCNIKTRSSSNKLLQPQTW